MRTATLIGMLTVAGMLVVGATRPAAAGVPAADARLHPTRPGRLIVKYRPTVDACAHCMLARGVPFATVTGTDSLDRLNRTLGVRDARPLFFERHGKGSRAASADFAATMARTRARFPLRAARAPAGAAMPDLSNVYVLTLPRGVDVARAAARYAADPDVEYAEPDYERSATFVPNDPYYSSAGTWGQAYGDLWGLQLTHAATAWSTATGQGTVVAVIDTGVDLTHPDLAANAWANPGEIPGNGIDDDGNGYVDDVRGWDFVDGDASPTDQNGHGTHVAGTVAAAGNNAVGVVGMAFGARVMAVRGLDSNGSGPDSTLAQAMVYAAENGADVLNASWGGFGISNVLRDAVATVTALGAVTVAAAGNDGGWVSHFSPAGIPPVISVAASQPDDTRATFSNFGDGLSIAAPGVDVLSLKASTSNRVGGSPVGSGYLRLSGTSMASPHAAGLAAVLLSAEPALTIDEVRWHLELSARQPGYPGYEGRPWNPYLGWGRLDATNVLATPPATTRLAPDALETHAYADAVVDSASSAFAATFAFTTRDPVSWTMSGPAWLPPARAAGVGDDAVKLGIDTRGVTAGDYAGSVVVATPQTVDGGASMPVTLHVHDDLRLGPDIPIAVSADFTGGPALASDGLGTLVAWTRGYDGPDAPAVVAARLDGAGNLSAPATLASGTPYKGWVAVGWDGRNFVVVWSEESDSTHAAAVKAVRVAPGGAPIDTVPIVIDATNTGQNRGLLNVAVGFDGDAYTILWTDTNIQTDIDIVYVRRLWPDGTLRTKRRRLYPLPPAVPQIVNPKLACGVGQCLVAWTQSDGEVSPLGAYVDKAYAVRLAGDVVLDPQPFRILTDAELVYDAASDGQDYAILAWRNNICAYQTLCGRDAVAARVGRAGVALDPDGFRIDNGATTGTPNLWPGRLTFDGTAYVGSMVALSGLRADGSFRGWQLFATRFGSDGVVRDDDRVGQLIHAADTVDTDVALAATGTDVVFAWADSADNPFQHPYTTWDTLIATRALPHARVPALPALDIGAIGPRTLRERDVLSFTVSASGLTTGAVFSAPLLPPGAVFDPLTRAFRWQPTANEAGTYTLRLLATDGRGTAVEDVPITVTERIPSVSGRVQLADGTPVPGVAVKLKRLVVASDATGRFRFDDVAPGSYRVGITKPSTHAYASTPLRIVAGTGDVANLTLVVTPRIR